MPISTPSIKTALENSLDMCFSALYMHELHRKYHHGEYQDLDNLKEENSEELNNDDTELPLLGGHTSGNIDGNQQYQDQPTRPPALQLKHNI